MVLDDHAAKVEANASSRLCAGKLVAGLVERANVLQTYLRDSMTRSFLRVSVLFLIKVRSICLDDWQDQQPWRASFAAGRVDRTNWGMPIQLAPWVGLRPSGFTGIAQWLIRRTQCGSLAQT